MKFKGVHATLHQEFTDFLEREIRPHVPGWEEKESFPARDLFRQLGRAGFLGISKPKKYGGRGADFYSECVGADALNAIGSSGLHLAVTIVTSMATPALSRFGSDSLKQEFLAPTVEGESIPCIAITEEGAGSDVAQIKMVAQPDGDDLILNGTKMWAGGCTYADWACVLANSSDGPVHKSKSLLCVPMGLPGITVSETFNKMSWRILPSAFVNFDNVRIPKRYVIGELGHGFRYQMIQFQEERLAGSLGSIGQLRQVLDQTLSFVQDRELFGKKLAQHQYVAYQLAELRTELELLTTFMWTTIQRLADGEDVTMEASMAKLKVGRLARTLTDSCLQFWGGRGILEDYPLAAAYRDQRAVSIGAGTDETMLGIIAKQMGLDPL